MEVEQQQVGVLFGSNSSLAGSMMVPLKGLGLSECRPMLARFVLIIVIDKQGKKKEQEKLSIFAFHRVIGLPQQQVGSTPGASMKAPFVRCSAKCGSDVGETLAYVVSASCFSGRDTDRRNDDFSYIYNLRI